MKVFVLDNGAGTLKAGYSTDPSPRIIPNCVSKAKNVTRRVFVGDQLDECKDLSGIYFQLAFQRGFLVNWEVEKQVWDYTFGKDAFNVNFNDTSLIFTEPIFNFPSIQEALNEVFFEEYQFQSVLRINGASLSAFKYFREHERELCCLVVDSGYSYTHVVPFCKGKMIKGGVKRLNVGGKALTNHLKEVISYRQLMMMDETYVVNQIKEDCCFVSQDFYGDMEVAKQRAGENVIAQEYVLPDYADIKRGFIRDANDTRSKGSEQVIRMNNERFTIPELLFFPSDIGIQEMGIHETIEHSIDQQPEEMRPHFYRNLLLTGGNGHFPGFKQRIEFECRKMALDDYPLRVELPKNPSTHAWQGGCLLAHSVEFDNLKITRKEYEENGHLYVQEKYDI